MISNQSNLAKETGTIELAELLDSLRRIGEKTLGGAEDLYEYIVDTVHRLTHSPVAMWRVDEKVRTTATIRAYRGLREEYVRDRVLDLGHSVTGEVIQTAKFIEIVDIQNDPRVSPASMVEASQQGWESMLVVPLLAVAGRAVGTLSIYSLVQKKFTALEIDLLHVFASQAGAAIQNADSFQTIQRLSEVGQSLTTLQESPEVLQETLERIANTAMEVLGADTVDLYQYQTDRGEFVLPPIMAGKRRVPDLVPKQIFPDDVVFKVVRTGEKIYASDAQGHPILTNDWQVPREERSEARFVVREEIVSSAAVPMKVDEEVVGVMFASYRQRRDFDAEAELRERIEVLAHQGAIAINNARLVQSLRDRADEVALLQQVSAEISTTLKLDKILPSIVKGAMRLTKTESGVVHIVDSSGEKIVDSYGYPDAFNHPSPRISEEGYTRLIVQKKKQQVVANAQVDKRASPEIKEMGIRSFVGTPLKLAGERVVGVLYVNDTSVRSFTEKELSLLNTLADHAAIAIDNGQLLQELDERASNLAQLHEITTTISAEPPDIDKVSRLIVDKLGDIFQGASCAIRMYDSKTDTFRSQMGVGVMEDWVDHLPRFDGTSRYIVQNKMARYLEGNALASPHDGGPAIRKDILALGVKAVAYLPLVSEGDVVGILYVNLTDSHRFSTDEKQIMELFADQAATAIRNVRLYKAEQERADQLALLNRVGQVLTSTLNMEQVLATILEEVRRLLDVTACSVWLIEPETGELVCLPAATPQDEVVRGWRLASGEGICGWVARHGESLLVPDAWADERYFREVDEQTGLGLRSILTVPLQVKAGVIGTLQVLDTKVGRFSEADLELLEPLAASAAIAIENAQLYDQRSKDIAALQEINTAITTTPWQEIAILIAQKAKELTQADYSGLWTVTVGGDHLAPAAMYGQESMEGPSLPIDEHSINGCVAMTGKPYKCCDASDDPHYLTWREDIQSSMAVPLKWEGQVIGTLGVESTKLDAFSDYQLELLQSLADQAAIAIENARLYEQRGSDLAVLQEINEAVVSKTPSEVLDLIVQKAVEVMPGEHSTLWLKEPDTGDLVLRAVSGPAKEAAHKIERLVAGEKSISMRVVQTGEPYICANVEDEPSFYLIYEAARSAVTVPLKYRDQVIGTLNVESSQLKAFTERHGQLLDSFADQAAIAIENARLYEQRGQDISALVDINRAIPSQSPDEITRLIATKAGELVRADYCILRLVDSSNQSLISRASAGWESRGDPLPIDDTSFTGWVVSRREAAFCNDVSQAEHYLEWHEDVTSCMAAPLMHRERLVGTLYVESTRPDAFSADQLALLQSFADQAAIAIENARMYEQRLKDIAKLGAVNEVGQTLTSGIGLGEKQILELIYEQATPLMDTSDMYIALYEPDPEQPDEYNSKKPEQSIIHGTVRFGLARDNKRQVDVEHEEGWKSRKAGYGLTEYVIRTRQLFRPSDVDKAYETIAQDYIGKIPESWMGVPMMMRDEVLGVVVLRNDENENVYNKDDQEVLQMIARQSAIALQNARLVQQLEQRVRELDTLQELAEELDIGTLPDVM